MSFQLGKALATGLTKAEDILDDLKDVLDFAADARLLILQLSELKLLEPSSQAFLRYGF